MQGDFNRVQSAVTASSEPDAPPTALLGAAAELFSACAPPASVRIVGAGALQIEAVVKAAGYRAATADDAAAALILCETLEGAGIGEAVARLAPDGIVILHADDPAVDALQGRGLFASAASTTGWVRLSQSVAALPEVRSAPEPAIRSTAFEQQIGEQLARLIQQNTQIANAIGKLSYDVSLKGRAVGILRRTGLLRYAASVLHRMREARSGTRALGSAASTIVLTLSDTAVVRAPIVIAAEGPAAEEVRTAARAAGALVIDLIPGNGMSALQPALIKPSPETFAGWLAAVRAEDFAAVRTFMIDPVSDPDGEALLRGRLHPDQTLLTPQGRDPRPADPGHLVATKGQLALYAPSEEWLDALGPDGRPSETRQAATNWPKISMVMVSFNQVAFLEQGIRSIIDQDYPNLEFIMVDGASKDGSIDVIERYHDSFDVLIVEKDRGQSDGLTKGFDRATGDIVSWLNSDDLLLPGALFRVAEAFMRHRTDVVAGGCLQVKEDGVSVVHSHHNHLPFGRPTSLPLNELLDFDNRWLGGCFFFQPEVFFTRDIWLRAGGGLRLDLYYVLDYDLWLRMAGAGATVVHIPDFLASSRIHEQQKTTFGETPFVPESRRLLAEYADGVQWTRPRAG
ncbi:glycosyltransferase [Aurantimonas litoralis]|nr:glycosyltransferase [Aurantimonas litoralis]